MLLLLLACLGPAKAPEIRDSPEPPVEARDSEPVQDSEPCTPQTWLVDLDGDGYGDYVEACEPPGEVVELRGDCDDTDPEIHPWADEDCDDGVDQDCDALVDCEDGNCVRDPACSEADCSDGVDNDEDGLSDCDDDDCIRACMEGSRVRAVGGWAQWRSGSTTWYGAGLSFFEARVEGELQLPAGTTCGFDVHNLTAYSGSHAHYLVVWPSSVSMSSACPVQSGSWVDMFIDDNDPHWGPNGLRLGTQVWLDPSWTTSSTGLRRGPLLPGATVTW